MSHEIQPPNDDTEALHVIAAATARDQAQLRAAFDNALEPMRQMQDAARAAVRGLAMLPPIDPLLSERAQAMSMWAADLAHAVTPLLSQVSTALNAACEITLLVRQYQQPFVELAVGAQRWLASAATIADAARFISAQFDVAQAFNAMLLERQRVFDELTGPTFRRWMTHGLVRSALGALEDGDEDNLHWFFTEVLSLQLRRRMRLGGRIPTIPPVDPRPYYQQALWEIVREGRWAAQELGDVLPFVKDAVRRRAARLRIQEWRSENAPGMTGVPRRRRATDEVTHPIVLMGLFDDVHVLGIEAVVLPEASDLDNPETRIIMLEERADLRRRARLLRAAIIDSGVTNTQAVAITQMLRGVSRARALHEAGESPASWRAFQKRLRRRLARLARQSRELH